WTCCGREYDRLPINFLSSQRRKPLTCYGREYDRLPINFLSSQRRKPMTCCGREYDHFQINFHIKYMNIIFFQFHTT
ncbi:MAG: hypothetical protein ACTTIZ_09025, partial [Treponema sp.]